MSRRLTAIQAKQAFEELAVELPKQHLRLPFRKRFGTGELLGAETFHKSAVLAPRDKPLTNLLQELPESVHVTRLTGTAEDLSGMAWNGPATGTIGEVVGTAEVELLLIVQGAKAKLYVYSDPTEDGVYVRRIPFAPEPKAPARPAPARSRTGRLKPDGPRSRRAGGR